MKTLQEIQDNLNKYDGDKGELTDGYHSYNELYDFRLLLQAAWLNQCAKLGLYNIHKSKIHSDGESCFGGGWFIVVATLPTGQISNHYPLGDWDLFQIPEKPKAVKYDGHSSQDVLSRMRAFIMQRH